jgi:basic membrane protein A
MVLTGCGSDDDAGSGASGSSAAGGGDALTVGIAYDVGGRGDKSFNDSAAAGIDKAKKDLGVKLLTELSGKPDETTADKEERLRNLADGGAQVIVCVGFAYGDAVKVVSKEYPDIKFQTLDTVVEGANIASYTFKDNESAYLVGAVAALASKTGTVGMVGGVNEPLIQNFAAGYKAGAEAAKPGTKVLLKYIAEAGDYTGYSNPPGGKTAAAGQYDAGADIIYAAAGLSNNGVFEAAAAKKQLAIGTDSDQYLTADAAVKQTIIASALKRLDTAVFTFLSEVKDDKFKAGATSLGVKEEGVSYVINSATVKTAVGAKVEELKAKIADGSTTVPSVGS